MNLAMSLGKRIAQARKAKGRALGERFAQEDLASAIGAGQTTVAGYEKNKNEPSLDVIRKMAVALDTSPEWLAFAVGGDGAASLALVPEIDAHATAGAGGLVEVAEDDGEAVLRRYGFPRDGFRSLFGTNPGGVVILEVKGDSMAPTLVPGERVIVNTSDRSASPPGIFVVWDGLGLVLKRVEFIAHSDPPRVRIMSDNPRYEPYERELGEAAIQGRIIGSLQRR